MESLDSITVASDELQEDRFSRLRLIGWWDQEKLAQTKVLVVGAGALGNEIVKNLALLGFRQILIVDLDNIENSNLSRSILFRSRDIGQSKAKTAAVAAQEVFEDLVAHHLQANIIHEVGLGVFGWADLILGGLDNREARLWINRSAWKMNRPWIDGAIQGIDGLARVFLPGQPPCYECTLGETDWQILAKRMSCNLLTREEMQGGRVPTTPTISSIIAGVQVQEAVKLIHGLPVLSGKAYRFEGLHHTSDVVEYTENQECLSHETFSRIVSWTKPSSTTSLDELFKFAQHQLGAEKLTLEFSRDVIHKLVCPQCGREEEIFAPVGTVSEARGRCPQDNQMREVKNVHNYSGQGPMGARTVRSLGLPAFDVFVARSMSDEIAILMEGDRGEVLGPLAQFDDATPSAIPARSPGP
jgi:adenylyltransferase/sulfurtransferase